MDLELYGKMLQANSVGEAFVDDTVDIVNNDFQNSPSYTNITINGLPEECQLKTTDKSNIFKIFLRPLKSFTKGMYVVVDNSTFIITNYIQNKVYPKAEITLCNNTLRWKDSNSTILEYKCIITGNGVDIDDATTGNERFIVSSNAELVIRIPYNDDTKNITANTKFIFDDSTFEVDSIDKLSEVVDGQGIIKLTVKAVSSTPTTTPTEEEPVVYDDNNNSGWGGW